MQLVIGSRRSQLAQTQAQAVRQLLTAAWDDLAVSLELMDTTGDLNRADPLPAIGGKGLFTAELEEALRQGQIDLAVHSLKDLPVADPPGLSVVAYPPRAAVADMLVSRRATRLADLPEGAIVGTSSLRRGAQVLRLRPDVRIKDIRGNVETRLRKLDEQDYDAILLARAGLDRLGLLPLPYAHPLPLAEMLPAPGQGALGIQGRVADEAVLTRLAPLQDLPTWAAVCAERAFLAGLGGGCSLPIAALGRVAEDTLSLQGLVASPDGSRVVTVQTVGAVDAPHELGERLAQEAKARGAMALLGQGM